MSPTSSRPPEGDPLVLDARPYTPACEKLLARGEHALIGVSANNGYFTQRRLTALLEWAWRRFASIDVVYADLHLDSMLVAAGHPPHKAPARAARAVRDTRRRIRRAVESIEAVRAIEAAKVTEAVDAADAVRAGGVVGVTGPMGVVGARGATMARLRVRSLSQCVELPGYRAVRRRLEDVAARDERVRRACEEHVRHVLRAQNGGAPPAGREAEMLRAGLAYLWAELPTLFNTPEVFGVPSSVLCYHKTMPVLHSLYGAAAIRHEAQGYVVLRPRDPA
ncbi:tRNA-dependent cyclodipeptide synthase [Nonomuraea sp. FMUSA5-5]|uniref:Cyclodipeptide synthase n=1 Tax=Nonomuraea composti TaxID=2720023 RepID=A0ABX1BQ67_9ACTN|nr:tRNA-dependent cyclodipeptide synthase [Nonomuraea sp. FMUSA5-5]NJP98570.1 tRNA-dependent cyclodipeptide synthase [Nonomuraea sp. FMUSA5-5]